MSPNYSFPIELYLDCLNNNNRASVELFLNFYKCPTPYNWTFNLCKDLLDTDSDFIIFKSKSYEGELGVKMNCRRIIHTFKSAYGTLEREAVERVLWVKGFNSTTYVIRVKDATILHTTIIESIVRGMGGDFSNWSVMPKKDKLCSFSIIHNPSFVDIDHLFNGNVHVIDEIDTYQFVSISMLRKIPVATEIAYVDLPAFIGDNKICYSCCTQYGLDGHYCDSGYSTAETSNEEDDEEYDPTI